MSLLAKTYFSAVDLSFYGVYTLLRIILLSPFLSCFVIVLLNCNQSINHFQSINIAHSSNCKGCLLRKNRVTMPCKWLYKNQLYQQRTNSVLRISQLTTCIRVFLNKENGRRILKSRLLYNRQLVLECTDTSSTFFPFFMCFSSFIDQHSLICRFVQHLKKSLQLGLTALKTME